jgi:glucose-1-phosphate cytidylyltransferase
MKAVILAGGMGSRLAEETDLRPKPMVEIGGRPILWHIMKLYAHHGITEFVIALGYKGDAIKRYFVDYFALASNLTVRLKGGEVSVHDGQSEDWTVHLIDTGLSTMTGGRVRRLRGLLGNEPFLLTYGDGVSNVDIGELLAFHRAHKTVGTVTAVRPPARFGGLVFDGNMVAEFTEKPQIGEGWINGGFMVFEPEIFDYLEADDTVLEADALERLAEQRKLAAFRHDRFWQCMDTLRDKHLLEAMWSAGKAPWQVWT